MTQPGLGDYFPLDHDTIRTRYIKAKAGRFVESVTRPCSSPILSTATTKRFVVHGDSRRYTVWLRTGTSPWTAACSRGGVHDMQADGEACSHGLAAAVAWELQREAVTT